MERFCSTRPFAVLFFSSQFYYFSHLSPSRMLCAFKKFSFEELYLLESAMEHRFPRLKSDKKVSSIFGICDDLPDECSLGKDNSMYRDNDYVLLFQS